MLVAAGDALIGCTLTAPIESPDVPTATFKPLDVTVGVFFTPEFENYTYVRTPPPKVGSASILFELGPPSRELFSQLFEATFRETVLVNSHIAASDGGIALDAIIEPSIARFAVDLSAHTCVPCLTEWTVNVRSKYEVVLWSPDGVRLATWSGAFSEAKKTYGVHAYLGGQIVDEMMSETAAHFLAEFPENEDVTQWLESALTQNLDGPQIQPTPIVGKGKWKVSVETNPSDDSTIAFLILTADSGTSSFGQPTSLEVHCKSNKTEMYIDWKAFLGSKASVLTRIGSEKAQTKDWELSTDSQSTLFPGETIAFLKKIMVSDKFVAQVTPYIGNPITAIFDTRGMSNAIKPIRETCGW